MAEWLRQGPAKPCTRVRFPPPPRAISSVGERYLDTVEVTGSIPVSPTSTNTPILWVGSWAASSWIRRRSSRLPKRSVMRTDPLAGPSGLARASRFSPGWNPNWRSTRPSAGQAVRQPDRPATTPRWSLAAQHAVRAAVMAVDGVFRLTGARAVYPDQPLQRYFRDLHTLDTHTFLSAEARAQYSKHLLGVSQPPQLL